MAIRKYGFEAGVTGSAVTTSAAPAYDRWDSTPSPALARYQGSTGLVGWSYSGRELDADGRPLFPISIPILISRMPDADMRIVRTRDGRFAVTVNHDTGAVHCSGCDQIIAHLVVGSWASVEHVCLGKRVWVPVRLSWHWAPGVRPD